MPAGPGMELRLAGGPLPPPPESEPPCSARKSAPSTGGCDRLGDNQVLIERRLKKACVKKREARISVLDVVSPPRRGSAARP